MTDRPGLNDPAPPQIQNGGALRGLRVLEIASGVSAAWCARQFALWGADVVTLEPAPGSPLRRRSPVAQGHSLLWEYVSAGKHSVLLEDDPQLVGFILAADVLVTDRPDILSQAMRAATIERRTPLTVVSLSPFGAEGPLVGRPSDDLIVQALSGYLSLNGAKHLPPLRAPGHILEYATGVNAFVAAMADLIGRLDGSAAGVIEVSELETIAAILPFLRVEYTGVSPTRDGGPSTGVRVFQCLDGYVSLMPPTKAQRETYGQVLGIAMDEWPAFGDDADRTERRDLLGALMEERTRPRLRQCNDLQTG